MKARRLIPISLFFSLALVFSVFFMPIGVFGTDNGTQLNLTSFPTQLADALSMSDYAGQILASCIAMAIFILPAAVVTKGRSAIAPLFMGFVALAFCIAVNWLDPWYLIVLSLLVALLFAARMRDLVSGVGGGGEG